MATKRQVQKAAVMKANGRIDRTKTVQAILEAFGPMTDIDVTANLQRIDDTATVQNVQWALYQLRKAGDAKKTDDNWAV